MAWHDYVSYFFGGAFLSNALPHFISGVMGRPFQTPFATPHGKGLSSSTINVLWGSFNLVVAYVLLGRVGHFDLLAGDDAITAGAGLVLTGLMSARLFGRFHGGDMAKSS